MNQYMLKRKQTYKDEMIAYWILFQPIYNFFNLGITNNKLVTIWSAPEQRILIFIQNKIKGYEGENKKRQHIDPVRSSFNP